jgi:hypothetical protein
LWDETEFGGRDDGSQRGGTPTGQDPPTAATRAASLVAVPAAALATAPIARPAGLAVFGSDDNTRFHGVIQAANLTLD